MRYADGKVLDIGCGPGRVALYIQLKSLNVTGLDISPLALKVSKLRGVKKVKLGSLHKLEFGPQSFDALVMFGNNFNLVGTPDGTVRFLRQASRITTARGEACGGSGLYRWLVRKGFPLGYAIYCMNCNLSRAKRGMCVHTLKSLTPELV